MNLPSTPPNRLHTHPLSLPPLPVIKTADTSSRRHSLLHSLQFHRQPAHDAAADRVTEWMLLVSVVQYVED